MTRQTPSVSFLLALGLPLLLAACGTESADVDRASTPTRTVLVQTAGTADVRAERSYPGAIEGARRVQLSTRVMGRVLGLSVDEGDAVSEGDVLVRIDDGQLSAQLAQAGAGLREARANLDNARTNFERFETLLGQGSATQREFDDAKTALESAESRVSSLEARIDEIDDALDYTVVRAPVTGVIAARFIDEGAMASPGMPLLTVETIDDLKVVVGVPEADVNRLSPGQEVQIHVDAAGQMTTGVIEEINRTASGPGRSYSMRVRFRGDRNGARPGMFARVSVSVEGDGGVVTVPEEALIRRGQLTGVYTLATDDRAVLRWIRTGRTTGGAVEVLSGLAEGERYIIPGEERLVDGQPVTVMHERTPESE